LLPSSRLDLGLCFVLAVGIFLFSMLRIPSLSSNHESTRETVGGPPTVFAACGPPIIFAACGPPATDGSSSSISVPASNVAPVHVIVL
jgi:hypothetical protein